MRALGLLGLGLLVACAHGTPPSPATIGEAEVVAFGFTTSDLDAPLLTAVGFGEGTRAGLGGRLGELGGLPGAEGEAVTRALGDERFVLTRFSGGAGRAVPEGSRSQDLWFQHIAIVVQDIDEAYRRVLTAGGRPISAGVQTIPRSNPAAGGIRAFYFRDGEGHALELIWYPPGKGDPRWQDQSRLFLGLDHSAIGVRDTAQSRAFYESLGLHVAGESLNEGPEQAALSGVPGARVRITGLRGARGPGVELLEYLAPRDGRPFPESTPADLVHWEITIATSALDALVARYHGGPIVQLPNPSGDTRRTALIKDPDGHTVRLIDR